MAEFDNRDEYHGDTYDPKKFRKPTYEHWAKVLGNLITNRNSLESRWTKLYNDYRGEQTIAGNEDEIIVNVTFGHIRVLESILYFQDPYFRVRPRADINLAPRAQLLEENLNSIWYAERVGREVRRCIVDACLTGVGWCLVGYSDYHDPEQLYKEGHVFVKRVSPLDLYTEDDINHFSEATFYARRGTYSTRWLSKIFKKEWKPDMDNDIFKRRGISRRDMSQATLFEILDVVENKLFILSPQHKQIIYKTDYPYDYYYGSMYVPLLFVDDPERLYPISMTAIVEGQQDELNRIRTQQMRHRKRFNRRYLMAENTMDDDEIQKVEHGEDGTIAKCRGNPKNVMAPIEDAPLDPGSTRDYQMDVKADQREILGINEYLRSGYIPRTKTAQEASMIQQGSNIRAQNLAMYLHEFITDIARRIILVIQNEMDDINHITRMDGSIQQWTKEDVAGDYEIEVEIGSTLPPQPIPYEALGPQKGGQPGQPGGMLPGTTVAPESGGAYQEQMQ